MILVGVMVIFWFGVINVVMVDLFNEWLFVICFLGEYELSLFIVWCGEVLLVMVKLLEDLK